MTLQICFVLSCHRSTFTVRAEPVACLPWQVPYPLECTDTSANTVDISKEMTYHEHHAYNNNNKMHTSRSRVVIVIVTESWASRRGGLRARRARISSLSTAYF